MSPDSPQPREVHASAEEMDVRLIRLNEDLRTEIERLGREIEALGSQNIELAFTLEELEGGLARLRKEAEEAQAQRARLQQELGEARGTQELRQEAARAEAARRQQDLHEAREESAERLRDLELAREESERILRELEGVRRELSAAREEADRAAAEAESGRRDRAELEARLQAVQEQARSQEAEVRQALERLQLEAREAAAASEEKAAAAAARVRELEEGADEQRRVREALERERDGALRERDSVRAMLEPLEANLASSRRELERLMRDRAAQDLEIAALKTREAELEGSVARLETQAGDLRSEARSAGALRTELENAQARIASLEGTLAQVKREHLERAAVPAPEARRGESSPPELLGALMSDLLGATGRLLVGKVYARCAVDPETRDPERLAEVTRVLEETALRLCRSDEQRARLSGGLRNLRGRLASGAPEALETPETPEAPEAEAPAPEPTPAWDRPRRLPSGLLPLTGRATAEVAARVAEGMKLLGLEKHEDSFDLFTDLAARHGDVPEVQAGLFYNYAAMFCWLEAYQVGRQLVPTLASDERFVASMKAVLKERIAATRNLTERKRLTLELGELLLERPAEALDQLLRAATMPDPIREGARIDFYLLRLLAETREDRLPHLLRALEGVAESLEPFDHLAALVGESRHKGLAPRARTVLALLRHGRGPAAEAEAEAPAQAASLDPSSLKAALDPKVEETLSFLLDRLLPRAGMDGDFPPPPASEEAPSEWAPALAVRRLDRQVFGMPALSVRRRLDGGGPLVEVFPGHAPMVLLSPALEGLEEEEIRFLAARALFRLHRRHAELAARAQALEGATRARLARQAVSLLQASGTEVSHTLAAEVAALGGVEEPARLAELLDRLYEHCLREEFRIVRTFVSEEQPFSALLDREADRFAASVSGLVPASGAALREGLEAGEAGKLLEGGLESLYRPPLPQTRALRLRLQNLWAWYLGAGRQATRGTA